MTRTKHHLHRYLITTSSLAILVAGCTINANNLGNLFNKDSGSQPNLEVGTGSQHGGTGGLGADGTGGAHNDGDNHGGNGGAGNGGDNHGGNGGSNSGSGGGDGGGGAVGDASVNTGQDGGKGGSSADAGRNGGTTASPSGGGGNSGVGGGTGGNSGKGGTGGSPTSGVGGAVGTAGITGSGGASGLGGITGTGGSSATPCGGLQGLDCKHGGYCEFPTAACGKNDVAGTCTAKPDVCSALVAPVCGCDGKTYSNDCIRQNAGVSKAADGTCPTDAGGNGGQ